MELMLALNFLSNFAGAKEMVIALANLGKKDPEALKDIILFLKIKTAKYDKPKG